MAEVHLVGLRVIVEVSVQSVRINLIQVIKVNNLQKRVEQETPLT